MRGPTRGSSVALFLGAVSLSLTVGGASRAQGSDFSPTVEYTLCTADSGDKCTPDYYASSVAQYRTYVSQDDGEEELKHVTVKIPAGVGLPKDRHLENGEELGSATIEIAFGPGCAGGVGKETFPIDGRLIERDRTDAEAKRGVRLVVRIDLTPIPPIDLKYFGNKRSGYRVETEVPEDPFTCPPFSFDARYVARTESGVPLWRNPPEPGSYLLKAILHGQQGSVARVKQRFQII